MSIRSSAIGLAVVIVLMGAGAAQSLSGSNTVFGDDIVNDEVSSADVLNESLGTSDIRNESLGTSDILNGSLMGADVLNSSLRGGDILNETITGADVGDNSLKGDDIDESTLDIEGGGSGSGATSRTIEISCSPDTVCEETTAIVLSEPTVVLIQVFKDAGGDGNTYLSASLDGRADMSSFEPAQTHILSAGSHNIEVVGHCECESLTVTGQLKYVLLPAPAE